jgi:hypothetical protein
MGKVLEISILLILFIACKNAGESNSHVDAKNSHSNHKEKSQIDSKERNTDTQTKYVPTDLKLIDTVYKSTLGYQLRITPTDSLYIQDYDIPSKTLDSLIKLGKHNRHLESLQIEKYQISKYSNSIRIDSIDRFVKLIDNEWLKVNRQMDGEIEFPTFEMYYPANGYYSFRVQMFEGNAYRLINEKSGKQFSIRGRPFWSLNNKYVIAVVSDIDAGYSPNGLSLYKNENNELEEVAWISPMDWGPKSAKWVSNNEIILKCDYYENDNRGYQQMKEAYLKLQMKYDD